MIDSEIEIVKKSIIETLENIPKNYNIDYEITNINFFLEKYSDVFFEYSDLIFSSFLKYFEKMRDYSNVIKNQVEKNKKFCMKYLAKYYVSKDVIDVIFGKLFKNNILCEKDVDYLLKTMSGIRIIEIYLENGGKMNKSETLCLFNNLGECYVYELYIYIQKIINEKSDFLYCNKELLEYSSFIPLEDYLFFNIKNRTNITEKTKNNILSYVKKEEILENFVENFIDGKSISEEMLFSVVKSLNMNLILKFLNKKIKISESFFDKIINFFKKIEIKNDKFIYLEKEKCFFYEKYDDKYIFPREIYFNHGAKFSEIIKNISSTFLNYGYVMNNSDVIATFENDIIIEKFGNINYNDEFKRSFLNLCVKKNYYPYFDNKKYPPPDMQCLYEECKKKSNLVIIKKICEEILNPDIMCLRLSCCIDNNLCVIKYFVDKKKINPDVECLKNALNKKKIEIDLTDINKSKNYILNNGSSMIKYLYKKIVFT